MITELGLLAVGLILLVKGADWLVSGASALAKKYKVSDLAVGLTIVAFGTSAPELVVNIIAAHDGFADVALGNVIGSNNFNLFIILGLSGLVIPLKVHSRTVWREVPLSFVAAGLVFLLGNEFFTGAQNKVISRLDGLLLLVFFTAFLFYVYKQLKTDVHIKGDFRVRYSRLKILVLIIAGLLALIGGGRLVVDSAVDIAHALGVSEKIIGLTIVAAGTSLPELATSVVAAYRRNADIAIGNIVGSNIFNLFLILSASTFIRPVSYNTAFNTDLIVLMTGTLFVFAAMFTGKRHKLDRWEALLLLLAYSGYLWYLVGGEL